MFQTIQVSNLTPDQFAELVEKRSYAGTKRALEEYTPPMPEGPILPEYPTRRQTADYLQVSLTTLHDWRKDSDERPAILVPVKINGRVRYRRADVLAALKESRRFKLAKVEEGRGHAN